MLCLLFLPAGCHDPKKPREVWCQTGPARGQLIYPRAITYSKIDDCFYVIDRSGHVQRFEHDGKVSADWHMPLTNSGKPVGVAVGPEGNVYVADTHYARIVVYSPAGKLLRNWGGYGTGTGQFIYPTDVAFDALGNIYVSEYGDNDRIQVFDPTAARVIRTIGGVGQEPGQFSRPQSMVIDGETLYVTDACNHRIAVFTIDGRFMRNIGGVGSGLGQFRFPYGMDDDGLGHLVVAEFGNNRVQLIDKVTGKGLATWGMAGRQVGELAYPWSVAVDRRGRVVAVDSGNNRLQVFSW